MISSTILSMISFAVICVVGVLLHVFFSIKGVKGMKAGASNWYNNIIIGHAFLLISFVSLVAVVISLMLGIVLSR